jgi:hypothetical protein
MLSILHMVGVEAPAASVYGAISTKAGLTGWWTEQVAGDECVGGVYSLGSATMAATT